MTFDRWGNLLIADSGNDRIRKAVIVTYNPASHRKQEYTFNDKLEAIRQELLSMREKVRDKSPHWRNEDAVKQRYLRLCMRMHMPHELYNLSCNISLPERIIRSRPNHGPIDGSHFLWRTQMIIVIKIIPGADLHKERIGTPIAVRPPTSFQSLRPNGSQ